MLIGLWGALYHSCDILRNLICCFNLCVEVFTGWVIGKCLFVHLSSVNYCNDQYLHYHLRQTLLTVCNLPCSQNHDWSYELLLWRSLESASSFPNWSNFLSPTSSSASTGHVIWPRNSEMKNALYQWIYSVFPGFIPQLCLQFHL